MFDRFLKNKRFKGIVQRKMTGITKKWFQLLGLPSGCGGRECHKKIFIPILVRVKKLLFSDKLVALFGSDLTYSILALICIWLRCLAGWEFKVKKSAKP
jgi:hypothetical protein